MQSQLWWPVMLLLLPWLLRLLTPRMLLLLLAVVAACKQVATRAWAPASAFMAARLRVADAT